MRTLKSGLGKIELVATALAVTALVGCGTSHKSTPPPIASTAPAPEVTPPNAQQASAQQASSKSSSSSSKMRIQMSPEATTKQNTANVLAQMHQANLMEIKLGKVAGEKGSREGVRAYADQLVQDHTNLDQTLVSMAETSGNRAAVRAAKRRPAQEISQEKALERKLKSAKGADFDKLFLEQARSDHDKLIRQLQQDREDASDDALEALIDKTLPILKQDQELARILMKKGSA